MEIGDISLKNMLDKKNIELTEQHINVIMYNLLSAMNTIHTANIMHRDIKPQNILIDTDCGIKICDFGLSRSIPKKSDWDRDLKSVCKL